MRAHRSKCEQENVYVLVEISELIWVNVNARRTPSCPMCGLGHFRTSRRAGARSAMPPTDGVIGRLSLWIAEEFRVLRFRLMVKRGPWSRPQASEGEAQHGPFWWIGRIGQGDERLHCG